MVQGDFPVTLLGPARSWGVVTPSDTGTPTKAFRSLSWAVDGAISVQDIDGTVSVLPVGSLSTGIIHPIAGVRVNATGTTATGIVGYY